MARNQLLSAKQGSTTKETYTYDIVGNRLSSLGVSPYSYNSSNELTALPSGSYTYDNNGNTKTKPDGTQYAGHFPAVNIKSVAKAYILWETVGMGNKDAPKREKKKPAKKK